MGGAPRQLGRLTGEGEDEGGRKEGCQSPLDALLFCAIDSRSHTDRGGCRWRLYPEHLRPAFTRPRAGWPPLQGLSHEGAPGSTFCTVPSPLLSSEAGVYSRCTGMVTLCRGTRLQYLLWLPCFRQKKKNKRITAGRTQGSPKEHIHGQGGRMSVVPFVCSGRTRLARPPYARPPPGCDPALTRATAVRQNVCPIFIILRHIGPTTGRRQRQSDRLGAFAFACERWAQRCGGKT